MKTTTRSRLRKAVTSAHNEWVEAPWFVILIIAITALVGPGILWGIWKAVTSFLF